MSAELHVLVEADEGEQGGEGSRLCVNGRYWSLKTIPYDPTCAEELVDYLCVSYIWGGHRERNLLNVGPKEISTNTLPALSAAMQNTAIKAFWIDAFCIPTVQPARAATLESMGFIYSRAKEVRAVLSKPSFLAVEQLSTTDRLDSEAFGLLEADAWVQSVWTYQEVVNSQMLNFVCPGAPGSIVGGSHFLNGVGYSIEQYKKEHRIDSFAFRRCFPSLDALEELIADWMIAEYQKRSALTVMSNMDLRKWSEERNYFYSMIGAITNEPCRRSDAGQQHLAETFMKICESKRDFSFIYSSAARSTDRARRWRPAVGLLPSILPWHSWGESQPGHFDESNFLWLDRILELRSSAMSKEAKGYVAGWLRREDLRDAEEEVIAEHAYPPLAGMGFTGSRSYVPLANGMFFPQTPLPENVATDMKVLVSGTVRWVFGAPGIASYLDVDGNVCYVPGVFAGIVDDTLATSVRLP